MLPPSIRSWATIGLILAPVSPISVEAWPEQLAPSEQSIGEKFRSEGLSPSRWSNGPGDRYAAHSHSYHKVLYCVRGEIVFTIDGNDVPLVPGDRLEIPPQTKHSAVVGPDGVTCMEASR